MKKIVFLISLLMISIIVFAQYETSWTKTYGGASDDYCYSIIETNDSCYLFTGSTDSYGVGGSDYWLIKTDPDGDTLWMKTYGGANGDYCRSVIETSDSCFLLAGYTYSYGAGGSDFLLVKTNPDGDTLWTKTYGGAIGECCNSVMETRDSCYLLAGYTNSYGAGGSDYWIIKTDTNGDTLWAKTYGGASDDYCFSVIETSDSCFLLAGYTYSYGAGASDYWLIKTDTNGDTLWTNTYGGANSDYCRSVIETSDYCYILGGYTNSYGAGGIDYWLIKTDTNGDTLWAKTYGGTDSDYCYSVIETSDSCYLLAGYTKSYGAGGNDLWLVKTDTNGDTLWTKTYGGANYDYCRSVIETSDYCYILGGYTNSYGAGGYDYWIVKVTDVSISEFSIIGSCYEYISLDTSESFWHEPTCNVPVNYNLYLNNDTISVIDTTCQYLLQNEGRYIWTVSAWNNHDIEQYADNADTFWVDRTPPTVLAVEEIEDTNFSGPYKLRVMAEDTMAGIDSLVIRYALPDDTVWGHADMTNESWLWYEGYIPQSSQIGYAYYYLELYDKTVPSNWLRYPVYPDLYSFRITGLTGVLDNPASEYSLNIRQFSNTGINFTLPDNSPVSISVYDINGRVVLNKSMTMPKGNHTINLDIMPGVYFAKVNTPYGNAEHKIINIK